MKTAIVGVVGLIVGILGALGYSHFLGEGKQVVALQDELAQSRTNLTKAAEETKQAKDEATALTTEADQLRSSRENLQKQIEASKGAAPAAPASPFANMGGMVNAYMARMMKTRFDALVVRLHLSPQQQEALKAAMEKEEKMTEDATSKTLSGGKVDMQAMSDLKAHKSVEQVLDDMLDPQQKTDYQKFKTDEKNSQAETMASVELNRMAPALQLNDTQKDQVYNALAQVQLQTADPNWIKQNNISAANPVSVLEAQAKAKEDALSKILTPDQLATYHQQAQAQLDMQRAMIQKFMPQTQSQAPANAAPATAPAQ